MFHFELNSQPIKNIHFTTKSISSSSDLRYVYRILDLNNYLMKALSVDFLFLNNLRNNYT